MSKKELDEALHKYAKEHGEEKLIDYLSLNLLASMKASKMHTVEGVRHFVSDFKESGKVTVQTE
jgi:hypothetical protein